MKIFKKNQQKNKKIVSNNENNILGWDFITAECEKIYPEQKNPKHYGTLIKWRLGGNDPLDGISIYETDDYFHFVTYGLSELYEEKETDNLEISGYGMEFTFKLKKDDYEDTEKELNCICGILQQIARITFTKGEIFKVYEYLYTGQTQGIDSKMQSNITGFITIPDPNLKTINTPHGTVDFVEFIGVTNNELLSLINKEQTVEELYRKLENDVTSYNRESVI